MSFRYETCVVVDCDECGTTLGPFVDLVDAVEAAPNLGWRTDEKHHRDGGHHWCPDCQNLPHECAPDPQDPAACARCGAEIAAPPLPGGGR